MIFYIYSERGEWAEVNSTDDIIFRKGLNNWVPIDYAQERVFHQRLGNSWQYITQKEQRLIKPSYYY